MLMRHEFWRDARPSSGTFLSRHHLSLVSFPAQLQTSASYHLAGINSPSKESVSEPICFHGQMLFTTSLQEDHFPWVWNQNSKATVLNALPGSSLLSAERQQCQAAPDDAQVSLPIPSGSDTATVSSLEPSDSDAKNDLSAFTSFSERKPFQFSASILINTLLFFLANSSLSNHCFIRSSTTCFWDKCFYVFLLQNIIL